MGREVPAGTAPETSAAGRVGTQGHEDLSPAPPTLPQPPRSLPAWGMLPARPRPSDLPLRQPPAHLRDRSQTDARARPQVPAGGGSSRYLTPPKGHAPGPIGALQRMSWPVLPPGRSVATWAPVSWPASSKRTWKSHLCTHTRQDPTEMPPGISVVRFSAAQAVLSSWRRSVMWRERGQGRARDRASSPNTAVIVAAPSAVRRRWTRRERSRSKKARQIPSMARPAG